MRAWMHSLEAFNRYGARGVNDRVRDGTLGVDDGLPPGVHFDCSERTKRTEARRAAYEASRAASREANTA